MTRLLRSTLTLFGLVATIVGAQTIARADEPTQPMPAPSVASAAPSVGPPAEAPAPLPAAAPGAPPSTPPAPAAPASAPPPVWGAPPAWGTQASGPTPPPATPWGQAPPGYAPYGQPYNYGPGGYGPPPVEPPAPTQRASTPMFVAGIVTLSVGGVVAIIGSAVLASSGDEVQVYCDNPDGSPGSYPCRTAEDTSGRGLGIGLLVAGGVGVAAGIPLLILGSRRVPADPAVAVRVGPNGAEVVGSF